MYIISFYNRYLNNINTIAYYNVVFGTKLEYYGKATILLLVLSKNET